MKKIISLFLIIIFLYSLALPSNARANKKLSQLKIREIQTRVYPTANTNEVFKATINTLQDQGFTIENIEDELGYIKAKKEFKDKRTDKVRATWYSLMLGCSLASAVMGGGATSARSIADSTMRLSNELAPKTVVVDTNANIEPFGEQTRVRLTLVEKVLYNADGYSYVKSAPRNVVRIYNPLVYREFFTELDKSIFYENI